MFSSGFNTYIPASELNKLSDVGVWRADLKMQVKAWDNCYTIGGCPGIHRVDWKANIILKVTDYGNQQNLSARLSDFSTHCQPESDGPARRRWE
ncbi:CblD like pilus biogenesis initiator [Serratia fonticola]|uniref:CblD like pilus biogenesis initiator n=1 Tax=Serratia fonticola TaxID=47917 RepID=A0A4U9WIV1_SERFO|nr:CblD like pilus biogenesis initiator [Serratia fonticola]